METHIDKVRDCLTTLGDLVEYAIEDGEEKEDLWKNEDTVNDFLTKIKNFVNVIDEEIEIGTEKAKIDPGTDIAMTFKDNYFVVLSILIDIKKVIEDG